MAVEIIEQTEAAVLEARVTVVADSTPRALERAARELDSVTRGMGKVAAVTESQTISRRELDGGQAEYVVLYGQFSAQQLTAERVMDGMEAEGARWVESSATGSFETVLKFQTATRVKVATIDRDGSVRWASWGL